MFTITNEGGIHMLNISVVVKGEMLNCLGILEYQVHIAQNVDKKTIKKAFHLLNRNHFLAVEIHYGLDLVELVYFDTYEDIRNNIVTIKTYITKNTSTIDKQDFTKYKYNLYRKFKGVK